MLLHHIGIVVDKLDEAIPLFEIWMGGKRVGGIVEDQAQGARIQLMLLGNDSLLEIVESLDRTDTALHKNGEFHLCFTVPDLDAEMRRLHDLGAVVSRGFTTAPHFGDRRLAFLATDSGQLLELLEDTKVPIQ